MYIKYTINYAVQSIESVPSKFVTKFISIKFIYFLRTITYNYFTVHEKDRRRSRFGERRQGDNSPSLLRTRTGRANL